MKAFAVVGIVALSLVTFWGCASDGYATRGHRASVDSLALMTKQDVIALTKAGVGNDVIVTMINTTGSTFQLRTPDVVALADSGVADTVIHAMLKADDVAQKEKHTTIVHYYPPDYYWWYGNPYYDPWFWSGYYAWPRPYYGFRVHGGFYGGVRHR